MPLLQTSETTLSYEIQGTGAPVLLIQGVGISGTAWEPQVQALRDSFTTLSFDNRGLGRSVPCRGPITIEAMAGDARLLMDHLGWESAHIAGHSMGGVIAQQLALDDPNRVRSLALLCTFVRGKDAARPTPWVIWMSLRARLGTLRMRRRAFLEMIVPRDELRKRAAAGSLEDLAGQMSRWIGRDIAEQPSISFRQLGALGRHDTSQRLRELATIPTLVMSADQDRIAPVSQGEALAAAIPGAWFERISQASHAVTLHDPPKINLPVRRFLIRAEALWKGN